MVFPNSNAALRTDAEFREKKDNAHHMKTSIIERINNLDMISDFPISDPLHLLDIGVMKRCLTRWLFGTKNAYKKIFRNAKLLKFDKLLRHANKYRPIEIHRSIRNSNTLLRWKATEFRTILLYVGVVVFKQMIPAKEYTLFLNLYCAVKLCMADFNMELDKRVELIGILMKKYVNGYKKVYGVHTITSNIHNLIHISEDIKRFLNINTISTYPFENHLSVINRLVRAYKHPLTQVINRLAEIDSISGRRKKNKRPKDNQPKVEFPINGDKNVFQTLILNDYRLSSRRIGDSWFQLKSDNTIVKFQKVVVINDEITIYGKEVAVKRNFFSKPFLSQHIDVFISNGKENRQIICKVDHIKCKLSIMPYEDKFLFQPLIHTLKC